MPLSGTRALIALPAHVARAVRGMCACCTSRACAACASCTWKGERRVVSATSVPKETLRCREASRPRRPDGSTLAFSRVRFVRVRDVRCVRYPPSLRDAQRRAKRQRGLELGALRGVCATLRGADAPRARRALLSGGGDGVCAWTHVGSYDPTLTLKDVRDVRFARALCALPPPSLRDAQTGVKRKQRLELSALRGVCATLRGVGGTAAVRGGTARLASGLR
jgi:hypothetical protein